MPRIIVKIHHMKAKKSAGGYVDYIANREGVDKSVNQRIVIGKPTKRQMEYIDKLLKLCPDAKESYEYEDYIENPTKQNASAFISIAAEQNPDIFESREIYLNYIATRPNVDKIGEHGLFGAEEKVELGKVKAEVAAHDGVIWTPIISLRREDAAKLGYDSAEMWQTKNEIETTITAKKFESRVMTVTPIFMVLILSMSSPDYMAPVFNTPIGALVMTVAILLFVISFVISEKIIDIEV